MTSPSSTGPAPGVAPPVHRGRRRLGWAGAILLVLAAVGIVIGVVISSSGQDRRPPPLAAGPGVYRITPQPAGHGAPAPQLVTDGSIRLGFTLGGTSGSGSQARAGMSIINYSVAGQPVEPFATYAAGDSVSLGGAHVTVLAVYAEPRAGNDAVDVRITAP